MAIGTGDPGLWEMHSILYISSVSEMAAALFWFLSVRDTQPSPIFLISHGSAFLFFPWVRLGRPFCIRKKGHEVRAIAVFAGGRGRGGAGGIVGSHGVDNKIQYFQKENVAVQ